MKPRDEVANVIMTALNKAYKGREPEAVDMLAGILLANDEILKISGSLGEQLRPLIFPYRTAIAQLVVQEENDDGTGDN